jgi:hypothetical protein
LANAGWYHRAWMGGGNALKAVTRPRRAAAGHVLGRAPGKTPGPAFYKRDARNRNWKLSEFMETTAERAAPEQEAAA